MNTSTALHQALAGNQGAWEIVVKKITPLLLAKAEAHAARLRARYSPEDLVYDTWNRALPSLRTEFSDRPTGIGAAVVRYLGLTMGYIVLERFKYLNRRPEVQWEDSETSGEPECDASRAEPPYLGLMRHEEVGIVLNAFRELNQEDQKIVLSRVVDGRSTTETANEIGVSAAHVSSRLSRALAIIRNRIPDSIFSDIAADGAW